MIEQKIAAKIKQIREAKGLTLAALSQKTELSKAILSRIENNRSSPPIGTLAKIAQGLGVPLAIFFEEEEKGPRYTVTRADERLEVVRGPINTGFTYHSISSMKGPHIIDAFILNHPPASQKTAHPLMDHAGEELFFVIRGEVEFCYGRETIRLNAGDSIHFDSSYPHKAQNAGEGDTECLAIIVAEGTT
jgi:transcriptional regulator with XRE-family HTH domain